MNDPKIISTKKLAQQIGTSEEEIISAAKSGDLGRIFPKLSQSQAQQIKKLLSDEASAKKLLATPEAQAIIRKLSKK